MTPELLLFYLIAAKLVIYSLFVICAKNPIHSVLALIVAFLCATGLFILANAEFLAWILAIVYVGAVAILFLFCVMMFDVEFDHVKSRIKGFGLMGIGVAVLFATEIIGAVWFWKNYKKASDVVQNTISSQASNVLSFGHILYTDYFFPFQLAGMVLLVAMIGAIVLTLKTKSSLKRQNIEAQLERSPKNTLRLMSVESKKGLLS